MSGIAVKRLDRNRRSERKIRLRIGDGCGLPMEIQSDIINIPNSFSATAHFFNKERQKVRQTILNLHIWYLLICILAMVAEASGQTRKMNQLDLQKWTLVGFENEITEENAPKYEIATRSTRKNLKPLPAAKKQLSFPRTFTRDEYRQITFGHIPKEMEDKWFVLFENDKIYFHRSWTGFCMFEVELQPAGEGYSIKSVWVNRDTSQNEETDDEFELQTLSHLIDRSLLGKRKWFINPNNLILNDEKTPKPYIEFNTSRKNAAVFSGCSQISATIETTGQEIKYSNFKEEKKLCTGNELETLQRVFLGKLERITRFELSGAKLKLYEKDKLLLTFEGKSLPSK
jgi:hypothetical protein